MNLYIETEDGTTKNHPAYEDNLMQAFGEIPTRWEPFIRVQNPEPTVYQVFDSPAVTYQKVNGVWMDVWMLRNMTDAEKATKQQITREAFSAREQASNWSAWILDETTCTMVPPIPRPNLNLIKYGAGILTVWSGADNNWKDTPVRPDGDYKFDFFAWQWVEITTL